MLLQSKYSDFNDATRGKKNRKTMPPHSGTPCLRRTFSRNVALASEAKHQKAIGITNLSVPMCCPWLQLRYVTETNASLSCQTWKGYLYDALKLEPRIRFMQRIQEDGSAAFCLSSCDS